MMENRIDHYIESLIKTREPLFAEMEAFAREHRVPIMEPAGIEALLQIMRIQQPKRILEIGTAIGYSALRMAAALPDAEVVSIERDEQRYRQAMSYIGRSEYGSRVEVLFGDALELVDKAGEKGPYDAIFIDAAKGQYTKFFERYSACLTAEGTVYTDNVLFKGYVAGVPAESKRIINLVKKIQSYNEWLMNHPDFDTALFPVGDGLAVSRKRGGK
ncbi:O-methyltransferase [Pseudobacillus badius]|uniref:O-methyltransferase n=1 Tax=Bacillus badius TaxID=1455 RepID=UPI0007B0A42E|nr:O-methyltransferase [Bacillus badius]KZN98749.1 SAM-dependent methyltransferase [Bacillus badius]MED0666261.1 O-methyltransferase [Bacillus badius]OCS83687.1 SAM-dependent methyltransferase [Bacillus badius]OVE53026.1 SAM-dependent methyltransferase [Bacillus badius]UAT29642.1 O-methyltransferase [Bacillus badius]